MSVHATICTQCTIVEGEIFTRMIASVVFFLRVYLKNRKKARMRRHFNISQARNACLLYFLDETPGAFI